MMLAAQNTDYGALNGLVQAASTIVAAAAYILSLWWLRPKLADVPDALIKAGEVVPTAIGVILVWTQLSEVSSGHELIRWIKLLGIVFAGALVCLVVLSIGWTYLRNRAADDEERVVTGFWLTPAGKTAAARGLGVQDAYEAFTYNTAAVWPALSRILAQGIFLILDLVVAVCGSVALTSAAMLLLIYQVPRIYEFSISPLSVEVNGTATLHWRISGNASKVELDPLGSVAQQGDRPETIAKSTQFKLTASNSYGSRSVEQGVAVVPPTPKPPAPPEPKKTTKKKNEPPPKPVVRDIVVEARTCSLILNVVIRGAGWLESENEKDPNQVSRASCAVTFPRDGKYEVFITYAAADSWPVRVDLNQQIMDESALAAPTGGWGEPNQKEQPMGVWTVKAGTNEIGFYREHPIPHIQRIRFRPSS